MGKRARQGFITETDNRSMKIEIVPTVEQIKFLAVGLLEREDDIREVITRLEMKLKETRMLAEAVLQEDRSRKVTEQDVYPNRKNSNFVGD